ncbi:hypothetical protein HYV44_03720 [Candidatus Microgenomates bacterium]|nr:hypothetical protein [Candidatus Microgenomates bacterium]
MNKHDTNYLATLKAISAIALLIAVLHWPYFYYQFLRWLVCGVSAYSAYSEYEEKDQLWLWIFAVIAIIFNPIASFYFQREIWATFNVVASVIFIVNLAITKRRPHETK